MNKYQIGIVGYGDFSKVIIEYLSPYANILVSSRRHHSGDAGHGAKFATTQDVLSQQIVIPSIPSQFLKQFFIDNLDFMNPNALVIDVCSVKTRPMKVLREVLPDTCRIIGTHPMFGPASISKNKGIKGLKCVVCSEDKDASYSKLIDFLKNTLELNVIEMTDEQHDREMAYVQGLSHYIGRVMDNMGIPDSALSTLAYDDLIDMKRIQGGDSWDLFESIMKENPYAKEVNTKFIDACKQLDAKIDKL